MKFGFACRTIYNAIYLHPAALADIAEHADAVENTGLLSLMSVTSIVSSKSP